MDAKKQNIQINRAMRYLQVKGWLAKAFGVFFILCAAIIAGILIYTFILGKTQNIEVDKSPTLTELARQVENISAFGEDKVQATSIISKAFENTHAKKEKITDIEEKWFNLISLLIIRVGVVLIGLYLIQIFISFAKYQFRIANKLSSATSIIHFAGIDKQLIEVIAPIISTHEIDFVKSNTLSYRQIVKLITEKT